MKTNSELKSALEAVTSRSDEIAALAEIGTHEVATLFSQTENNVSIDRCLALAHATAHASPEALFALRAEIERARDSAAKANTALAHHMTRNPLVMAALQGCEGAIFGMMACDGARVISLARTLLPFSWIVRRVLSGVFADIRQQVDSSDEQRTIRVEIVRKKRPVKGMGRGRHTPGMDAQLRAFRDYLDSHPVCASRSVIDRARECWRAHAAEWDAAAADRRGYSSYKALAQAV